MNKERIIRALEMNAETWESLPEEEALERMYKRGILAGFEQAIRVIKLIDKNEKRSKA